MYINRVVIKNFRNFDLFDIELNPFTVIIGENNIGKSNLLNAISLVLSDDIQAYRRRRLEVEDFNINAITEFKKDIIGKDIEDISFPEIRIDLYVSQLNLDQETIVDNYWFDFEKKIARLSYLFSNKSKRRKQYLIEQKEIIEQEKINTIEHIDFPIDDYEFELLGGESDIKIDNYYLKMLKIDYLEALRDAKKELNSNSERKLLYKILSDREETQFSNIKDSIIELDKTIKNDKKVLETLKQDIGDYLNKISLETETSHNNVDFAFSSLELSEILKKISLQYGDNAISIDRNGLGRNNLLYIAVIMAHLYKKSNEYFRLIALEEPEAHLAPILQRHLSANIKDENNEKQQIILTTHSPYIASCLDLKNTVIIYKNKDSICNHYILNNFNIAETEDKKTVKYLQKWLNATNSTMFFSRKIIFVEGIAEEILLPIFYRWKYNKNLDKINCQVVNVNGVAFSHFLDIVRNGYFVKTAVITDSDDDKKTEKRADKLKQKYDSDTIRVFITKNYNTFEKELFNANKSNKQKRMYLTDILGEVRPIKCDSDFRTSQNKKFNIDILFSCIEEYKSEFAFELKETLEETLNKGESKRNFDIPQYIIEAFEFINEE